MDDVVGIGKSHPVDRRRGIVHSWPSINRVCLQSELAGRLSIVRLAGAAVS